MKSKNNIKEKKLKHLYIKAGKEFEIGNGAYFSCCDCGLTHKYTFKVGMDKNGKPCVLYVKAWRAEKLTKEWRKKYHQK